MGWVYACHSTIIEVRAQPTGVGTPLCESWRSNSGFQALWKHLYSLSHLTIHPITNHLDRKCLCLPFSFKNKTTLYHFYSIRERQDVPFPSVLPTLKFIHALSFIANDPVNIRHRSCSMWTAPLEIGFNDSNDFFGHIWEVTRTKNSLVWRWVFHTFYPQALYLWGAEISDQAGHIPENSTLLVLKYSSPEV